MCQHLAVFKDVVVPRELYSMEPTAQGHLIVCAYITVVSTSQGHLGIVVVIFVSVGITLYCARRNNVLAPFLDVNLSR